MNENTIYITEEHLGEGTEEQAREMVRLLAERGWNVRYGSGPTWNLDADDQTAFDRDWNECLNSL